MAPHKLNLPSGESITVFSVQPSDYHSESERRAIEIDFPFFHRKIIANGDALSLPAGGYLLSRIDGQHSDDRFTSYFSAAEVVVQDD
ncbi:MAG TPA: hypothetical protein VD887_02500 [Allosphingosinicella sp.]|nr:hypothetical protein [Allosphingosinicella sp.]